MKAHTQLTELIEVPRNKTWSRKGFNNLVASYRTEYIGRVGRGNFTLKRENLPGARRLAVFTGA